MIGKEDYGKWGLVLSTSALFGQVGCMGISSAMARYVAYYKQSDTDLTGKVLTFGIYCGLGSLLILGIACAASSYWLAGSLYSSPDMIMSFVLAGLLIVTMFGTQIFQSALSGFEAFSSIAITNILQGTIFLIITIPLTYFFGYFGSVLALTGSYILTLFQCVFLLNKHAKINNIKLNWAIFSPHWALIWEYALPSLINGLLVGPALALSQSITVNHPAGIAGFAGFQVAMQWRTIALFIPTNIKAITLPMLAKLAGKNEHDNFRRTLWAHLGLNCGLTSIIVIPILIASPFILSLYGNDFIRDWPVMIIVLVSCLFQTLNDVVTQVLACKNRMWHSVVAHLLWGGSLLLITKLLTPFYGIKGLAYAFLAATFVHALYNSIISSILIYRTPSDSVKAALSENIELEEVI